MLSYLAILLFSTYNEMTRYFLRKKWYIMIHKELYKKIIYDKIPYLHIDVMKINFYPLHMHKELEFIIVIKGKIRVESCYYQYIVGEGEIYLVNKDTQHLIEKLEDECIIASIFIDPQYFEDHNDEFNRSIFLFNTIEKSDFPSMQKYMTNMLHELIQVFFKFGVNQNRDEDELCVRVLFCLVNYFRNWHKEGNSAVYGTSVYKGNALQIHRLSRAIWYIYENYNKRISLEDIANELHISKFYLSHLFKNGIGCSIQDFITKVRFDEAMKLLYGTDLSTEEIAAECGFTSMSFFKKSYARHATSHFGNSINEERMRLKNKTILTSEPDVELLMEKNLKKILFDLLNEKITEEEYDAKEKNFKKITVNDQKKTDIQIKKNWRNIYIPDISDILIPQYLSKLEYVINNLTMDNIIINMNNISEYYRQSNNWGFLNSLLFLLKGTNSGLIVEVDDDSFSGQLKNLSGFVTSLSHNIKCIPVSSKKIQHAKADTVGEYFALFLSNPTTIKYVELNNLITDHLVHKVGYYALKYIDLLSTNILNRSNNHIATISDKGVQLIIHKSPQEYKNSIEVELVIKIINSAKYVKQHFIFNSETGKDNIMWDNIGVNKEILPSLLNSLEISNGPAITLSSVPQNEYDIYLSLKKFDASIYILNKI